MTAPTIEELWQSYAAAVGVPVGGTQWRETRRAFYAGASALLGELQRMPEGEAAGVARLEGFRAETEKFAARVVAGGGA